MSILDWLSGMVHKFASCKRSIKPRIDLDEYIQPAAAARAGCESIPYFFPWTSVFNVFLPLHTLCYSSVAAAGSWRPRRLAWRPVGVITCVLIAATVRVTPLWRPPLQSAASPPPNRLRP